MLGFHKTGHTYVAAVHIRIDMPVFQCLYIYLIG